jgi:prevent-host-death family protein
MMGEIRVGVRDLKARLSEYLRQVKQGHVLVITDHGLPVGRLLPAEQTLEEKIRVLREAGMVYWNGKKLEPMEPVAINYSKRQVSDILVEMRE